MSGGEGYTENYLEFHIKTVTNQAGRKHRGEEEPVLV